MQERTLMSSGVKGSAGPDHGSDQPGRTEEQIRCANGGVT
jgi:hypothetical protein